jgi:hypothetical protein
MGGRAKCVGIIIGVDCPGITNVVVIRVIIAARIDNRCYCEISGAVVVVGIVVVIPVIGIVIVVIIPIQIDRVGAAGIAGQGEVVGVGAIYNKCFRRTNLC